MFTILTLEVTDHGDVSPEEVEEAVQSLIDRASETPGVLDVIGENTRLTVRAVAPSEDIAANSRRLPDGQGNVQHYVGDTNRSRDNQLRCFRDWLVEQAAARPNYYVENVVCTWLQLSDARNDVTLSALVYWRPSTV